MTRDDAFRRRAKIKDCLPAFDHFRQVDDDGERVVLGYRVVEVGGIRRGYESILVRTDTATKAKALIRAFRLWRKIPFIR